MSERMINTWSQRIIAAAEQNGWYVGRLDAETGTIELLDGNGSRVVISNKYGLGTEDYVRAIRAIDPMPGIREPERA